MAGDARFEPDFHRIPREIVGVREALVPEQEARVVELRLRDRLKMIAVQAEGHRES
jgi:hypothetical protein